MAMFKVIVVPLTDTMHHGMEGPFEVGAASCTSQAREVAIAAGWLPTHDVNGVRCAWDQEHSEWVVMARPGRGQVVTSYAVVRALAKSGMMKVPPNVLSLIDAKQRQQEAARQKARTELSTPHECSEVTGCMTRLGCAHPSSTVASKPTPRVLGADFAEHAAKVGSPTTGALAGKPTADDDETDGTIVDLATPRIQCEHCDERPAVCIGYEADSDVAFACGECCAHGNEGGVCVMIDNTNESFGAVIDGRDKGVHLGEYEARDLFTLLSLLMRRCASAVSGSK